MDAIPVVAGFHHRPPSDDHEPHGAAASPSWTDPQMMKTPRPAPSKPYGTRSSPAATRRGRRPRRPAVTVNADLTAAHPPCRGRRPRRPAATVSASLTTFRRPLPRRGIISQYITWRTARFPPAVGVGVLDDPFLRPPPEMCIRDRFIRFVMVVLPAPVEPTKAIFWPGFA